MSPVFGFRNIMLNIKPAAVLALTNSGKYVAECMTAEADNCIETIDLNCLVLP